MPAWHRWQIRRRRRDGLDSRLFIVGDDRHRLVSLSLVSGLSAAIAAPAEDIQTQNTGMSHEITLCEEEVSDVSLATFYVIDNENAGTFRRQANRSPATRPGASLPTSPSCRSCCALSSSSLFHPRHRTAYQLRSWSARRSRKDLCRYRKHPPIPIPRGFLPRAPSLVSSAISSSIFGSRAHRVRSAQDGSHSKSARSPH